jgi:hypothetical protein
MCVPLLIGHLTDTLFILFLHHAALRSPIVLTFHCSLFLVPYCAAAQPL